MGTVLAKVGVQEVLQGYMSTRMGLKRGPFAHCINQKSTWGSTAFYLNLGRYKSPTWEETGKQQEDQGPFSYKKQDKSTIYLKSKFTMEYLYVS